jgi:hypothetical protein
MGVVESASRLFDLLATKDDTFTRHLRPGLPEARIRQIVEASGVELPPEAIEFYGHFSLPNGYQYPEDGPTLFGIYWMLSLEDAVEQYTSRGLAECFRMQEEEFPGSSGWFPLLQDDANFYVLDTAHTRQGSCAIVDASEYGGAEVAFASMQAFFDTLYHWVQEGALPVEEGHVAGDYEGEPRRVREIAARFNPGVSRWSRVGDTRGA